jgi:beta-phosphoglucomutase-like phosphatase (HAD superfamily)
MIRAVAFDLDGVIISSEEVWDEVRQDLVRERGGRWRPEAQHRMMGMSTPEWTAYMHEELGLDLSPPEIAAEVSRLLAERYRRSLPLLPGAVDAVRAASARWPLAVASSSPQELI